MNFPVRDIQAHKSIMPRFWLVNLAKLQHLFPQINDFDFYYIFKPILYEYTTSKWCERRLELSA